MAEVVARQHPSLCCAPAAPATSLPPSLPPLLSFLSLPLAILLPVHLPRSPSVQPGPALSPPICLSACLSGCLTTWFFPPACLSVVSFPPRLRCLLCLCCTVCFFACLSVFSIYVFAYPPCVSFYLFLLLLHTQISNPFLSLPSFHLFIFFPFFASTFLGALPSFFALPSFLSFPFFPSFTSLNIPYYLCPLSIPTTPPSFIFVLPLSTFLFYLPCVIILSALGVCKSVLLPL